MKLINKPGVVRRPAEYILTVLLVVLLVALALIYWFGDNNKQDDTSETDQSISIEGTVDSVNELTQDDLEQEQSIDEEIDSTEQTASSADGAADNIEGSYDESAF